MPTCEELATLRCADGLMAGGAAIKMLLRPREQDAVQGLRGVAAHSVEGLSMRAILFICDCSDTCITVNCKPAKVVVQGCLRCCVRVSKGVLSGMVEIIGSESMRLEVCAPRVPPTVTVDRTAGCEVVVLGDTGGADEPAAAEPCPLNVVSSHSSALILRLGAAGEALLCGFQGGGGAAAGGEMGDTALQWTSRFDEDGRFVSAPTNRAGFSVVLANT